MRRALPIEEISRSDWNREIISYPRGLFRKIKTFIHRGLYGVSEYDRASFDDYLMRVVNNYTSHYLKNGVFGVPGYCYSTAATPEGECSGLQEWAAVLYAIQEGASIYLEMCYGRTAEDDAVIELSKELLMENLHNLWT